MTGYRVGWLCGDESIISAFRKLKTNIDSGTPTFIQDAAISALKDEAHVDKMREDYKIKRDILVNALTSIGLDDCTPDASLYIWQKIPKGIDSIAFAKRLLQKDTAIVVTPGASFSIDFNGFNPGKDYVRFALVPTMQECRDAAKRIGKIKI